MTSLRTQHPHLPWGVRWFTERECARIMGFPEAMALPGMPVATTTPAQDSGASASGESERDGERGPTVKRARQAPAAASATDAAVATGTAQADAAAADNSTNSKSSSANSKNNKLKTTTANTAVKSKTTVAGTGSDSGADADSEAALGSVAYGLLGNAVCPPVIAALGGTVLALLWGRRSLAEAAESGNSDGTEPLTVTVGMSIEDAAAAGRTAAVKLALAAAQAGERESIVARLAEVVQLERLQQQPKQQ